MRVTILLARSFTTLTKTSTFEAQLLVNKVRNAVRFQSQNLSWDFEEVHYQSQAFMKGLATLAYGKDDVLLLRIPSAQQAEAYIAKLGTAGIQAQLILSKAKTVNQVDQQLKANNIKGIIFEPTFPLGSQSYIEVLNSLIPQLSKSAQGSPLKTDKYPRLRTLFQTNFYSYPGVYKFRSLLNYASDKYFKLPSLAQVVPLSLPPANCPIIVTNPAEEFTFKTAILNSIVHGRYVVCVQPKDVPIICQMHHNSVDLVSSESVEGLDKKVRVLVPKGSSLFATHGNRIEL